jgi:hypothetical protein
VKPPDKSVHTHRGSTGKAWILADRDAFLLLVLKMSRIPTAEHTKASLLVPDEHGGRETRLGREKRRR